MVLTVPPSPTSSPYPHAPIAPTIPASTTISRPNQDDERDSAAPGSSPRIDSSGSASIHHPARISSFLPPSDPHPSRARSRTSPYLTPDFTDLPRSGNDRVTEGEGRRVDLRTKRGAAKGAERRRARGGAGPRRCAAEECAARGRYAGRVSTKRAPPPGTLATVSSPPRRRAFSRAIARPSPLPRLARATRVGFVEAIEHVGQVLFGYPRTAVGHGDPDQSAEGCVPPSAAAPARRSSMTDGRSAVEQGVLHEVDDDPFEPSLVGADDIGGAHTGGSA